MKKNFKLGHNGDVQFITISKIPDGATRVENKPLALGEISGHAHACTGDVEVFENDGKTYLAIGPGGAIMQHTMENLLTPKAYATKEVIQKADHMHVELEPNTCLEVGIQNEYNPYSKLMEKSRD